MVIALFLRLIVERSRDAVSLEKALGFTGGEIGRAYFFRGFFSAAAGVISGLIFGTLLGEGLCGMALGKSAAGEEKRREETAAKWLMEMGW